MKNQHKELNTDRDPNIDLCSCLVILDFSNRQLELEIENLFLVFFVPQRLTTRCKLFLDFQWSKKSE